jgi:hypothetical protein
VVVVVHICSCVHAAGGVDGLHDDASSTMMSDERWWWRMSLQQLLGITMITDDQQQLSKNYHNTTTIANIYNVLNKQLAKQNHLNIWSHHQAGAYYYGKQCVAHQALISSILFVLSPLVVSLALALHHDGNTCCSLVVPSPACTDSVHREYNLFTRLKHNERTKHQKYSMLLWHDYIANR